MPHATFVLSTGRCGTQWLATVLREAYGEDVCVTHEPIDDGYRSRQRTPGEDKTTLPASLREHIDRIDALQTDRPYVETGFPCWSSLPILAEHLDRDVQVIHVTRPPAPTARSWVKRGAYRSPMLPHEPERVLLAPTDPAARFNEVEKRWSCMSPYEKALYFWAEVHAFALDLDPEVSRDESRTGTVPPLDEDWMRVSTEALFEGEGLTRIREFLGLPQCKELLDWRSRRVDHHASGLAGPIDESAIQNHAYVIDVAACLGYSVGEPEQHPSSSDTDE